MARGWESKSIEAQIDAAETDHSAAPGKPHTPQEIEKIRRLESLMLSRTRVSRELGEAKNPRYRAVLEKALADLNAQIGRAG